MIGRVILALAGAAVLAFAVGLVSVAGQFPAPGTAAPARHVVLFVTAILAVSLLHVGACIVAYRAPPRLFTVLLVAGAARLVLLFGAPGPILEGDPARLRFDGRLVNLGVNPYEFKPRHLTDGTPKDVLLTGPQLERLMRARAAVTASADAPRPEDVRRPDLRTAATPLALWLASLGDRFKPESTAGYRFLVFVADALAILFLVLALRALGLPLGYVIVYAWCPVLLKEAYCTLAVDAFVAAALAGLAWCLVSGKRLLTAVPVALAAGLRWPMLLLVPLLGRRLGFLGAALALLLFLPPLLPFLAPGVPAARTVEGQVHVWRHYEYDSVAENVLRGGLRYLPGRAESSLDLFGVEFVRPGEKLGALLAKVLCSVLLLAVTTYLAIRLGPQLELGEPDRTNGLDDLFAFLVALLVFSPVLAARHAVWIVPLLVLRFRGMAWLTLPALVATSYLTHIQGPFAADLTLFGDKVSFRAFWMGAFLLLLALDWMWARTLFPPPDPGGGASTEETLPDAFLEEEEIVLDEPALDRYDPAGV